MRNQFRPIAVTAMLAAAASVTPAVRGDTTAAFTNFAGDVSYNTGLSFNDSGIGGTGPMAFDPTNPNTLYIINRASPPTPVVTTPATDPGTGGAYPWNAATKTRIKNSSNANIFLTANGTVSNATTLAWSSATDPYTAVVGNDGSLYVGLYVNTGLYRVNNPLSDTPTVTRFFPGYDAAGDDDIVNVMRLPASFGAANYTANDLLVLDDGVNADGMNALFAVHADQSDGTHPTAIWRRASANPSAGTIHGAVDPNSGFVYFINSTSEHTTLNGSDYIFINRVKGDGILQTIGLKLPAGVALTTSDEPVAVNPVDGSVWLAENTATATGVTTSRTMLRIDTAYMTALTDPTQFLATVTQEFTATTGFNLGVNSMTFSNDGTHLYTGTPDGTDKVYVFDTLIHRAGDTNGDGTLNADDYALIDRGFNAHLAGWTNGDYNLDGTVDAADYLIIDTAYAAAHGGASPDLVALREAQFGPAYVSSLLAAVPEPAALAGCGLAFAAMSPRRRR